MILNPSLPAPSLPDAGRPYVESCTFDSATKQVKVRARTSKAGEVKNPVGEEQGFPIVDVLQSPNDSSQGGGWFVNKIQYKLDIDNQSSTPKKISLRTGETVVIQPGEKRELIVEMTKRGEFGFNSLDFKSRFISHMIYVFGGDFGILQIWVPMIFTDEF